MDSSFDNRSRRYRPFEAVRVVGNERWRGTYGTVIRYHHDDELGECVLVNCPIHNQQLIFFPHELERVDIAREPSHG